MTATYEDIEHETAPAVGPLFQTIDSMFCNNEGRPIGNIKEIFTLSSGLVLYLVENEHNVETLYVLEHGRVRTFDPEQEL